MFFLRVHSVDANHPVSLEEAEFTSISAVRSSTSASAADKFSERRGVSHLFRSVGRSSLPSHGARSTLLFVVAVPNYFSFDDFVRFCESRVEHVADLVFIRNDGMEDRYSVLIRLKNQMAADGFYCCFNGQKFSPGEAELCHILFLASVDYTDSAEIAGTPPEGCTELPTCPVCLERLDADTSGLCDHSFQCPCTSKWTYLSCQVCRLRQQQDKSPACSVCGMLEDPWVCVICGFVGCGRYKNGHALGHWKDTQHCYSLGLNRQQIWDYVGEAYVHRLNQSKVDGKLMNDINRDCENCDVQVPLLDQVDATHVIPSALLHGGAIGTNDTLPSTGQASTVTSPPISDLAFFEKLRVKMAEYDAEDTHQIQTMPLQSPIHTDQTPAILLRTEEAHSTICLAKTKTLDDFMEQGHLSSLQEAIRVLVQSKLLSSSVLTGFEGLMRETRTIADHPQKEIEYRLKLEAPQKFEASVEILAAEILAAQCKEALKVAQQASAKVGALEIQLQAAREELKAAGGVFLQKDELLSAQRAELLEKRAQARARVESARVGLSKLADERSAVEAALVAFKLTLNFLV